MSDTPKQEPQSSGILSREEFLSYTTVLDDGDDSDIVLRRHDAAQRANLAEVAAFICRLWDKAAEVWKALPISADGVAGELRDDEGSKPEWWPAELTWPGNPLKAWHEYSVWAQARIENAEAAYRFATEQMKPIGDFIGFTDSINGWFAFAEALKVVITERDEARAALKAYEDREAALNRWLKRRRIRRDRTGYKI